MKPCDQLWKLDALQDGSLAASEAASFERHARLCSECRGRAKADERLQGLVERLPAREPGELALRRLRERILSDARKGTLRGDFDSSRLRGLGALAVAAAVVAIAYFAHRGSSSLESETFAASVTPVPGTRWVHSRIANVETVKLEEGELWLVVRKQSSEERLLVETPDGELEVRGTTFDVDVAERTTKHVHVVEGRVWLRVGGRPAVELAAGDSWDRSANPTPSQRVAPSASVPLSGLPTSPLATPAPIPVADLPRVAATGVDDGRGRPSSAPSRARPADPAGQASGGEGADYEAAIRLHREGRYAEAAVAFRRFALHYKDSALAEDATFLEAVALTKAGQIDAGSAAAWRHLAEFPGSFHKKEASVLVARAARDRGDCKEATRVLAPWIASGEEPTIREALGACADRQKPAEPGN